MHQCQGVLASQEQESKTQERERMQEFRLKLVLLALNAKPNQPRRPSGRHNIGEMKMKNEPKTYHCKTWQDVANRIETAYVRIYQRCHIQTHQKVARQELQELNDDLQQMAKLADAACKELDSLGR